MPSILARMASATDDLSKRYYSSYDCGYGYSYSGSGCYYSPWSAYGRWILLAVIIVVAFIIFLAFSCITARRRRKAGRRPIAGTGWLAPAPAGHGQAQYTGNQGYNSNNQSYPMNTNTQQQYQPPTYAPPPANTTGHHGANESYFGGQEAGVTQPSNVYQPPSGPPPNKY